MSPEADAHLGFERLKALVAGDAMRRLDGLEQGLNQRSSDVDGLREKVDKLDAFVGDAGKLEAATAKVLIGALRAAEVERHRDLAAALAPLIVSVIRSEIKNSKEIMIEALYPITGRLVTAAVAGAFRDLVENLNRRIDALVSANIWRLRAKALMTGRSLAEVALAEADASRLKRALLLERGSGVVLASWPAAREEDQADLTSGLIAAITEFATTVYADSGGELRRLDLSSTQVILRASTRVIIAAEFSNEPAAAQEKRLDEAFLSIVELHELDGKPFTGQDLGEALNAALKEEPKPVSKTPIKVAALIAAGLIVWLSYEPATRAWREYNIRAAYADAMAKRPELAAFPLRLDIDHLGQNVALRGIVADAALAQAVLDAVTPAARPYAAARDVHVVAVGPPPSDGARLEALEKQLREAQAALAKHEAPEQKLRRHIETFAVFFNEREDIFEPEAVAKGLDELAALLKQTRTRLRVVGYADDSGPATVNRSLSRQRAAKVAAMLAERGVQREMLTLVPRAALYPIADTGLEAARSRRVAFELPYAHEFETR